MKRENPPSDVLLQYIYDYGIDKAMKLFRLDKETTNKILHHKPQYDQYFYNTVIDKPLNKQYQLIAQILADNYSKLKKKYTYYRTTIQLAQTIEDYFQIAVIKCLESDLEDITEESVLELFSQKINTTKHYALKSAHTMKKKVVPLELKNNEDEYFIPIEILKYES